MNYCTFPQRPPWGQEESGRGESRGKIGKKGKKEMKGKATLTSSIVSLTVRESKEPLMLLYRYDVDLVFYCLNIAFLQKYCYFAVYKQFICKR